VVWRVEIGRRVKAALRAAIALDGRLGPS
jgi:hypothetical protein